MRIISDFHDYYDVGMKYGIDNAIIYNREDREIQKSEFDFIFERTKINNFKSALFLNHYPDLCYIIFCGKMYPFISFYTIGKIYNTHTSFPFFTIDAFEVFLDGKYTKELKECFY